MIVVTFTMTANSGELIPGKVNRRNFSDNPKDCQRFMRHWRKFNRAPSLRADQHLEANGL